MFFNEFHILETEGYCCFIFLKQAVNNIILFKAKQYKVDSQ